MSLDGLVAAYRIDTGEEVRIPPHWLDDPTLSKPFTTTPPAGPDDTPPPGRVGPTSTGASQAPDLDKKKPTLSTTETPAAGAKE